MMSLVSVKKRKVLVFFNFHERLTQRSQIKERR